MKQIFLFLFTACLTFKAYAQTDQFWSFNECLNYTLAQNLQLKKQAISKQESLEDFKNAKSQRLPEFSAYYGHSFNRGRSFDPFTNEAVTSNVQNGNMGVQFSLPLINGGQIYYSMQQAKLGLKSAEYQELIARNEIMLQLAQRYLEVLFKYENIGIAEERLEGLVKQEAQAQILVKSGKKAISELFDLQAQQAEADKQLVLAENEYRLAMLNLKQFMQLDSERPIRVLAPEETELEKLLAPSEKALIIYEQAKEMMPEIQQAEINILQSQYEQRSARAGYLPSLSITGSMGSNYSSNYGQYLPDDQQVNLQQQLEDGFSQIVSLNLNIPLYSKRNTKTRLNKAKLNIQRTQLLKEEKLNVLREAVEQAYLNFSNAQKDYITSQKQLKSLEAQFHSMNERYKQGKNTATDYLISENKLAIAKAEMNRSKYQLIFNKAILSFYLTQEISF